MNKIYVPESAAKNEKFADTEEITRIIGVNLKRNRLERGLSLDEVSARSTVSKSMLSDIERGRKCPTAAVLYKICEGINVSLPSLLRAPEKIIEVSKPKKLEQREGYGTQTLFKYDINTSMEIHKARILPNTEIPAEAHGVKIWEYIMVIDGVFSLILDNEIYEIGKGEAIRFLANREHIYANRTNKDVLIYYIVYYGA